MIIKIFIAIGLIASFGLVVMVGFQPPLAVEDMKTEVKVKDKKIIRHIGSSVKLYPVVPRHLPDLYDGYLFNEERMLMRADEVNKDEGGDAHQGIRADIEDVMYVGSLIIGNIRKGLISYPNKGQSPQSFKDMAARKKSTKKTTKQLNYAQLLVGETFSDYKVVAVESDRIEFSKAGKTITKQLYDPAKKRLAPPRVAAPRHRIGTPDKAVFKPKKAVVPKRNRVEFPTTPIRSKRVAGSRNYPKAKPFTSPLPLPRPQ